MEIEHERDYRSPDVIKVVADRRGDVLYLSRSPIPWCRRFSRSQRHITRVVKKMNGLRPRAEFG